MAQTTPNQMTKLKDTDALIVVDVQRDFLPGGALAVPQSDRVIPPMNLLIDRFVRARRPVFFTRDWHPPDHASFRAQGGPWPPHAIAGTRGAQFSPDLWVPPTAEVVSKARSTEPDSYSGFQGTQLA